MQITHFFSPESWKHVAGPFKARGLFHHVGDPSSILCTDTDCSVKSSSQCWWKTGISFAPHTGMAVCRSYYVLAHNPFLPLTLPSKQCHKDNKICRFPTTSSTFVAKVLPRPLFPAWIPTIGNTQVAGSENSSLLTPCLHLRTAQAHLSCNSFRDCSCFRWLDVKQKCRDSNSKPFLAQCCLCAPGDIRVWHGALMLQHLPGLKVSLQTSPSSSQIYAARQVLHSLIASIVCSTVCSSLLLGLNDRREVKGK